MLVDEELTIIIGETLKGIQNAQIKNHIVFSSVIQLITQEIPERDYISETLDALIATSFDTELAADN